MGLCLAQEFFLTNDPENYGSGFRPEVGKIRVREYFWLCEQKELCHDYSEQKQPEAIRKGMGMAADQYFIYKNMSGYSLLTPS